MLPRFSFLAFRSIVPYRTDRGMDSETSSPTGAASLGFSKGSAVLQLALKGLRVSITKDRINMCQRDRCSYRIRLLALHETIYIYVYYAIYNIHIYIYGGCPILLFIETAILRKKKNLTFAKLSRTLCFSFAGVATDRKLVLEQNFVGTCFPTCLSMVQCYRSSRGCLSLLRALFYHNEKTSFSLSLWIAMGYGVPLEPVHSPKPSPDFRETFKK